MTPEDDDTDTRSESRTDPIQRALILDGTRGEPYLIVIRGSEGLPRMFRLARERTLLGRSSEADFQIEDDAVSNRHCELLLTAQSEVRLKDLGSTNGTYVNGRRVVEAQLADGDKLEIGNNVVIKLTFQDSLDQKYQEAMYEAATRDALTKTFNRRVLLEQLRLEYIYFKRRRSPLSLCIIDIDLFKVVNDTHGHLAGDTVLAAVAHTVHAQLRASDMFARYGGEEFAAVLRDCDAANALLIGERMRAAVEAEEVSVLDAARQPRVAKVTVSIGVATLADDTFASDADFLAAADKRLYEAKALGRNRVVGEPRTTSP